jgi:hypothetical protein
MKTRLIILSFIALVISFHALAAHGAGEPPRYRQAREQARENARNERAIDRHERIDNRYDHNRSYPVRGHVATALPRGYVSVRYRNAPYYFHRGAWYRPYGPRYIVVRPPIGVGIALLPPFYTTVWFGGVPYYYADDTYYLWRPERREYVVTQPPAGAGEVRDEAGGSDELFVYPKNGQSEERQTTDRDECHAWAAAKTGFDPARPPGNLEESAVNSRRADYRRAQGACLEARGYSVK